MPNELTESELNGDLQLTVGSLKKFLEENDFPDDTLVLVERVEDSYFRNHGWGVVFRQDTGTIKDENGNFKKETMAQYVPAYCCMPDDKFLLISMFY